MNIEENVLYLDDDKAEKIVRPFYIKWNFQKDLIQIKKLDDSQCMNITVHECKVMMSVLGEIAEEHMMLTQMGAISQILKNSFT